MQHTAAYYNLPDLPEQLAGGHHCMEVSVLL